MADVLLSLIIAKWPPFSPSGVLVACFAIMGIGLAIAIKWPQKPPPPPS